jgi:AIPR protein
MQKIIKTLLDDFRLAQNIDTSETESKAFEYFCAYLTIGSIAENTSTTAHTVVGADSQPSVDAIGIIINGNLVENEDEVDTYISINNYLDVDFVFVQAKTSENFDSLVLGDLGAFADSFIEEDRCNTDRSEVARIRKIKNKIYKESKYFKRRNPAVHIYYVTTGSRPTNDSNFAKKIQTITASFTQHSNTSQCHINLMGAKEIQELKRTLDNSIEREIEFTRRISLPQTLGIDEAYLGVVSAPTFLSLLEGPAGNMLSSIFYDNVRDWQGQNTVNSGISDTLKNSDSKARFVFMNNGVTIIAKKIRPTGDKILLEDYQIVNGCQTSNVLWNNKATLDDKVLIPLRIVATTDEKVITDIIRATNSQTEVTASQLLAATDFQKQLEQYFQVQAMLPLHYERRSKQYTNSSIDRAKILTPISLMKAYASIILQEPHKTTKDFKSIVSKAGTSIFGSKHKLELYYMAAVAQYWIDQMLRKGSIDRSLTAARFQILLAFKLLNQSEGMPPVESNRATRWAEHLTEKLNNELAAQANLQPAIDLVSRLIKTETNKRDAARSVAFTDRVIAQVESFKNMKLKPIKAATIKRR